MEEPVPENSPSLADDFVRRGDMLLDAKRFKDAHAQFLSAIASDPEGAWAHCRMGVCCAMQGRNAEAIEYGSKAVSLMPDWADAHYQLAWIYNQIGEKYQAEKAARNAIACEPRFSEAFVLLAWTFLDRHRLEEALEAVGHAIALQPEDADAFNVRGIASLQLGKLDDAEQALMQSLRLQPENATAQANLGYVYLHRGNWSAAEGHFRDALRQDPYFEYARLGVNEILRNQNLAFRWITGYRLWLDRQPEGFSWIVVFLLLMVGYGFAFLFNVDTETGTRLLSIAPVLLTFAVTGILVEPVSQAFALLTSAGRMLATRWEAVGSVLLTLYLLVWCTAFITGMITQSDTLQGTALVTGYAYITFAQTWRHGWKWIRIAMFVVSLIVAAMLGVMGVLMTFEPSRETEAVMGLMGVGVFVIGLLSLLLPGIFYHIFYQPDP